MKNALIYYVRRTPMGIVGWPGYSWACRLCGDHGGVYDNYEMARAAAGKHLAMKHEEPS